MTQVAFSSSFQRVPLGTVAWSWQRLVVNTRLKASPPADQNVGVTRPGGFGRSADFPVGRSGGFSASSPSEAPAPLFGNRDQRHPTSGFLRRPKLGPLDLGLWTCLLGNPPLNFTHHAPNLRAQMAVNPESPLDKLWQEYAIVFKEFDDLKLARWMAQTLGQLEGRAWRLSHPLLGAYRLAAQTAYDRGLGVLRLATFPAAYTEAECCRAPLLPLITRDVKESGLGCVHCGGTPVEFSEIPEPLRTELAKWADDYAPVHAVSHWDEAKQKGADNYQDDLEDAAEEAEDLLAFIARSIAPKLLEIYPAVIWEDQDECLEVRPEDLSI